MTTNMVLEGTATSSRKGEWTWRCLEARGIRGPEEEEVVEGSEFESRSWKNIFSW